MDLASSSLIHCSVSRRVRGLGNLTGATPSAHVSYFSLKIDFDEVPARRFRPQGAAAGEVGREAASFWSRTVEVASLTQCNADDGCSSKEWGGSGRLEILTALAI